MLDLVGMFMQVQTTVDILTRDRPELLRQTLQSVMAQDVPIRIRVSDNSVKDETQHMMRREFAQVEYLRRYPPLAALEHFRTVLSEADTPYLVMFHDDDVMLPGFVRTLQLTLSAHPGCVAVAGNADKLHMQEPVRGTVMGPLDRPVWMSSPRDLLNHYFPKRLIGPAPFPGYMYRTEATRGLALERQHGGKYSDVSFLLKVLERGAVLWLPDVLMHYRYHTGNDSGTPAMNDVASLIRFVIRRRYLDKRNPWVQEFRLRNWVQWLLYVRRHPELASRHAWRRAVVMRAVLWGVPRLVLRRPELLGLALVRLFGLLCDKVKS